MEATTIDTSKGRARRGSSQNDAEERRTSSQLPIGIEDEISWVLHEFRRQGSPIYSIEKGNRGNRSIQTKKRPFPVYFSDVRYHAISGGIVDAHNGQRSIKRKNSQFSTHDPHIQISYLFDQVLSLDFRVDIRPINRSDRGRNDWGSDNKSYRAHVAYFGAERGNTSLSHLLARKKIEILRQNLQSTCEKLNDNYSAENGKSSSSLFAMLSKLLLSLNILQSKVIDSESDEKRKGPVSVLPMTSFEKSNYLEFFLRKDSPFSSCSGGVDLAILLLRCAAVGKHAEVFAHPFPSSADSISKAIWNATESYQIFQRRRKANAKTAFHPMEHQLLGFLCSLPWMKRGKVTVTQSKSKASDTWADGRVIFEVCLSLDDKEVESDASHSPKFARSCERLGSMLAYHGTDMENVWSILHNGFFNASEIGRGGNEFVKNGAIMGSGVYLTTSKKVATYFASLKVASRTIRSALKHDALTELLSKASGQSSSSIDDLYDVCCFPVFEARIIRPPDGSNKSTESNMHQAQKGTKVNNNMATRHEGKYYVVPNGSDIRITKLHLTFELTRRKRGVFQFLREETLDYVMNSTIGASIILITLGLIIAVALGTIEL